MDVSSERGLLSFLAEVPDLRFGMAASMPYPLSWAWFCCAVMCGARSYAAIAQWAADQDIAFMHRLGFTAHSSQARRIRKVLIALNAAAFEESLTRWAESVLGRSVRDSKTPLQACALKGKTSCGSFDGLNKAVHLLSLVAHEAGLTIAQTEVPQGGADKTNEHKTALRLLKGVVLEGRLITGDAMFCQRDLSQQILDAKGHYLWIVKENQSSLLADIQAAFAPAAEGAFSPAAADPAHCNMARPWTGRRPPRRRTSTRDHRAKNTWTGPASRKSVRSPVKRLRWKRRQRPAIHYQCPDVP